MYVIGGGTKTRANPNSVEILDVAEEKFAVSQYFSGTSFRPIFTPKFVPLNYFFELRASHHFKA